MPSSRGSSQPRTQTRISCIAGEFFTPEPSGKHSDFSLLILTAIIRQNEVLRLSRLVPVTKPGINSQDHWVLLMEKTGRSENILVGCLILAFQCLCTVLRSCKL